jgi:hypothetical protein
MVHLEHRWDAPPGMMNIMSKRKSLSPPGRVLPLAFGVLFTLVGLTILTASWVPVWSDYHHGRQLAAEGDLAPALVLTKFQSSAGSLMLFGSRIQLVDYSVRYRFTTRSGRKIETDAKVTPEEWNVLEERHWIKVRYLPADAETNRISGQKNRESGLQIIAYTLIGCGFTAAGGLILSIILRKDMTRR